MSTSPQPAIDLTKLPSLSEIQAERCRRHLGPFVRKVFEAVDPGAIYHSNWHIDLICEYLEAAQLREVRQIIINMPPRFLKSVIGSVAFPAWLLGKNASEQILVGSYAEKLSIKHSIDCRMVIQTPWYKEIFPEVELTSDQNEKGKFVTTKRGHRIAVSVGGTVTGEGGNFIIIDDPHNPKKAVSDVERTFANDVWHDQTMTSRFNDPKKSVEMIIMQRLHDRDLTGHVLAKENANWVHLKIPQEAPVQIVVKYPLSGKKITREVGDLIHPDRFGPVENAKAKVDLGPYGYAGQQQQEPVPLGGGRIKMAWFPRYSHVPLNPEEVIISMDTGNKKNAYNNPTAIGVFIRPHKSNQWYLIQVIKDHLNYPELKQATIDLDRDYRPDTVLIEDKASGQSLIQDLQENTEIPVVGVEPEADKLTRMETQLSSLSAGRIMLPNTEYITAPWFTGLEINLSNYPQPAEWDEIDMLSQFLKHIRKREEIAPCVVPFSLSGKSNWSDSNRSSEFSPSFRNIDS